VDTSIQSFQKHFLEIIHFKLRFDLFQRALRLQFPLIYNANPVTESLRFPHHMSGKDDGAAIFPRAGNKFYDGAG
jgi:hypothetical protein